MQSMREEPLNLARLDHVSDAGDLVFEAMNRHFTVRIDDELERAILEAKQVRSELMGTPSPQASSALPISRIQSMIRAGVSPENIAEQFNVAQALVRRFAAPVETEKKYAIDQFLSMPTSKSAKNPRSHAEIIAEALQTSRIGMDQITWKATRRNHEPWRIQAAFDAAGRTIRADWSWNMRDNTVVSLNVAAKRLLGEPTDTMAGSAFLAKQSDDMASGRPTAASRPSSPASSSQRPDTDISPAAATASASDAAESAATTTGTRGAASGSPLTNWLYGTPSAHPNAEKRITDTDTIAADAGTSADAAGSASPDADHTASRHDEAASAAAPASSKTFADKQTQTTASAGATRAHGDGQKKRSGRSAVPSWDEILFGE